MTSLTAKNLQTDLKKYINPDKAQFFPMFFKTGKGQYGGGDKFLGVTVPDCRAVAKKYNMLSLNEVGKILKSKIHEERLTALFILVSQFEKGDEETKKRLYGYYLKKLKYVNNWDLVDASAYKIAGQYLKNQDRKQLYKLANSKSIWSRRVAIVSTLAFIRQSDLEDTFKISEILLEDKEDLIHKAVGWMLREAGKKDEKALVNFLKAHYKYMPRTALRYAIERFSEKTRKKYLQGKI